MSSDTVSSQPPSTERGLSRLSESRLESLLESAKLLNSTLQLDDILKHLLRTVMGRLLATRGAIAMQSGDQARIEVARGVPSLKPGGALTVESARAAGLDLTFPIGTAEGQVGLLALGKLARGMLDPEEEEFLRALLGLAASVIANAISHQQSVTLNRALDQKVQELRALLDLVRGLAATLDPEEVARLLVLTFAGRWAVAKYGVATWREGQAPLVRQRGLDLSNIHKQQAQIAGLTDAIVLDDGHQELAEALGLPAGSLVMPIRSSGLPYGVVVCGPRLRNLPYTEADLEFGSGLVAQAAVAFDNAWHFRDTIGKKQMEKELTLAANIQQELFPKQLPRLSYTDVAARNRQARQVGGDYYDVIPVGAAQMPPEHLVCVVDISGKGMFAALLMSNIQATLRALVCRERSLPIVAASANDLLHATTPSNRYATALLTIYEGDTGDCRWINCGHNDGIVLRANGDVEMLSSSGLALGLFPTRTYEEQTFQLGAGDLLAVYSDGVTDAQNEAEDEFGIERLLEVLKANAGAPAAGVVDRVFEAIDAFAGQAPQFDDITMLVLKRGGDAMG